MIPQAIKVLGMKHVAVMDSHNTTGDYVCAFQGVSIGEMDINPTAHGLTFFRWHFPHRELPKDVDNRKGELIYFAGLHQLIGLDAVVVFDETLGNQREEGLYLAQNIKNFLPDVKVLMHSYHGDVRHLQSLQTLDQADQGLASEDLRSAFYVSSATRRIRLYGDENMPVHFTLPPFLDALENDNDLRNLCDLVGARAQPDAAFNTWATAGTIVDAYRTAIPALKTPRNVFDAVASEFLGRVPRYDWAEYTPEALGLIGQRIEHCWKP